MTKDRDEPNKPDLTVVSAGHVSVRLPGQPDILPQIVVAGGSLADNVDEGERALIAAGWDLFIHAGQIVRPIAAGSDQRVRRHAGAVTLAPVTAAHLTELLTRSARWVKYDGRIGDHRPINCPRQISETYLGRVPAVNLRPLVGIIETPTLRPDGSILDAPGYDDRSGLYFAAKLPSDYSRPPLKPTQKQAHRAANEILDAIGEFAFVSEADVSAAVAGMISVVLRRSLPAAPMLGIDANSPASGKSCLSDTMALVATGRRSAVLSLGDDAAEGQKRLIGALLAGDAIITIDNVERPLADDLLCQVLTQPAVSVRPLGGSQLMRLPTSTSLIANGNGLDIRGDLRRRTMLIRLDSGTERPEQRVFRRNALKHVFEHRGKLIRAALTLPLAYEAADCPDVSLAPHGGFEEWDRWCRRPLVWLGFADPLKASESLRDQDPDLLRQRQLYASWSGAYGSTPLSAADVIAGATPELREALNNVCADHLSPRRLSGWLGRHRGRIIDNLRLDATMDGHSKTLRWAVTPLIAGSAGSCG